MARGPAPRGPRGCLGLRRARPQRIAMPTKAPADSAQQSSASRPSSTTSPTGSQTADASVLTEYRGLTVTDLADAAGRAAPGARPTTRSTRTPSPAGPQPTPGLDRDGRAARGPGGDRVRAARRRRGDRGQGAARLRQDQPEPRREGRDARAADAERRRRRGPRRRAAPRRSCSPASPAASRRRS